MHVMDAYILIWTNLYQNSHLIKSINPFCNCDQEIMILPVGAKKFEEALQMGAETYHHLKVNPPRNKDVFTTLYYIWWILCSTKMHIYMMKSLLFSVFPFILYSLSCMPICFHFTNLKWISKGLPFVVNLNVEMSRMEFLYYTSRMQVDFIFRYTWCCICVYTSRI